MDGGPARLTARQALASLGGTTRRILRHPANRGRRGRALALYVAWQVWERTVRRPWTIRLGPRRLRLHPHSTVAALVLYCRVPDHEELSFVRDHLRPGDLFVDVGANVGVYSLWASAVDGVDVVAFEPSTATRARMTENVELNGLGSRVEVRPCALGAAAGTVRLTTGLDAVNHVVGPVLSGEAVAQRGGTPDRTGSSMAGAEVVEQATLDDELGARAPAVVKVDVEGAELDVLRGGRRTILRHRPALLVEVNDPAGLEALLDELGYRTWRYDPGTRALAPTRPRMGTNVLAIADVDQARRRLLGAYAEAPVPAVSPPAPRTRLPAPLKALAVRRVPLVRLALLRRDLLRQSGWARSGRVGAPVAGDGGPLPWYTYPAIHFLEGRVRPDMAVFEYGAGHSTLWWSRHVAHVTAVESDAGWVARLGPRLPAHVDLLLRPAGPGGAYAGAAGQSGRRFDVIVIDGEDRTACATACLPALADDGVVVWDNADWTALWADGMRHLEANGFRRLDLRGLGPLNWREWTTTVFYRPGRNCLGL